MKAPGGTYQGGFNFPKKNPDHKKKKKTLILCEGTTAFPRDSLVFVFRIEYYSINFAFYVLLIKPFIF